MKWICKMFRGLIVYSVNTAIKINLEFQYDMNVYGNMEKGLDFKSVWIDKQGNLYRIKEYYGKPNRG
ncbi:MAG: hypothetical protein GY928_33565 [Colwellia sp.]|nr:hypothetical protein [Colwellia sp.]